MATSMYQKTKLGIIRNADNIDDTYNDAVITGGSPWIPIPTQGGGVIVGGTDSPVPMQVCADGSIRHNCDGVFHAGAFPKPVDQTPIQTTVINPIKDIINADSPLQAIKTKAQENPLLALAVVGGLIYAFTRNNGGKK